MVGALACGYLPDNVRDKAHEAGLYVLELNGLQVDLVEPKPGISFTAKEW
jgi:hypothetical protein